MLMVGYQKGEEGVEKTECASQASNANNNQERGEEVNTGRDEDEQRAHCCASISKNQQ